MKRVWILNHYAQVPGGPGGTRHYHFAEYLPDCGWHATVIAASTEGKTGKQRLAKGEKCRLELYGSAPFLWVKTPTYKGNGGGRMLNMLAYCWQVLRPGITKGLDKPDVIIGSSVHPFAAATGAILAKRFNVPFVFEVRDLWPQTLIDMGRLSENALVTRVLQKLELWLYKRATRIIALLPLAHQYIEALGIQKEKVAWIPNGVDISLFNNQAESIDSDVFTLMYFGAHGGANGLDNVLQAMRIVQEKKGAQSIQLRLIGDGPLKPSLEALAKELGLGNVRFEPPVPKAQIAQLAAEADAFVFNLIDAPVFRFGISSNKLFDFMAASRPVIFSCESGNNPVEDAKAGITVAAGKPDELSQAILKITTMPLEERKLLGYAGRKYVEENHDFRILSQRLADVLNACLAEKGH